MSMDDTKSVKAIIEVKQCIAETNILNTIQAIELSCESIMNAIPNNSDAWRSMHEAKKHFHEAGYNVQVGSEALSESLKHLRVE